ncbi:hypothetical protein ACWKW6_15295 [Dyadobacter jiangsuensis]
MSLSYERKRFPLESSINPTNQMTFTRRARGYADPGMLPSDRRFFSDIAPENIDLNNRR